MMINTCISRVNNFPSATHSPLFLDYLIYKIKLDLRSG